MSPKRQLEIEGACYDIECVVAVDVAGPLLNFHRFPEKSAYRVFYGSRMFPTLKGLRAICLDLHLGGRRKRLSGTATFEGADFEAPISRVTAVDSSDGSSFVNFDSMKDGSLQLVYTKDVIKNLASVRRIRIVREELPEVDEEAFLDACSSQENVIGYADAVMDVTLALDGETLSLSERLKKRIVQKEVVDVG